MQVMVTTAATPHVSAPPTTPRSAPPHAGGSETVVGSGSRSSFPTNVGDWLVERLGKAAFPVAIAAGGAAGAGLGFVTLGPVGAIAGGVAGGMLGALVVGLRP